MGVAAKLNSAPKHVVSTTLKKAEWNNASIISDNIEAEIKKLKGQSGNEIQIEGSGELVRSLMKAGLIDEYRLLVHPVVMGSGKRFFEENTPFTGLELTETRQIGKGVILLCYTPAKK
jgi:dihydrofolate reductase